MYLLLGERVLELRPASDLWDGSRDNDRTTAPEQSVHQEKHNDSNSYYMNACSCCYSSTDCKVFRCDSINVVTISNST